MLTDHQGNNFEPVAIKTSNIHSRREDGQCIEGCMACAEEEQQPYCSVCGDSGYGGIGNRVYCRKHFEIPSEPWRSQTGKDFNEFIEWIGKLAAQRQNLGIEHYEADVKGFQGNPLDHAIEEAFDLLLYLFYERRNRDGA